MKQFKDRKLNRLKDYDYSLNGYYYVTLCTHERVEVLGAVEDGRVIVNKYGEIVRDAWAKIPEHFKNVKLDEFIVMPNHIHGIIIINNPVGTGHALSSNENRKNNDLSVVIGSFKSAVTRQINRTNRMPFQWQRSFHDHIIRTTHSLKNIREYIINNPETWAADENNIINYSIEGKACLAPTGL